MLVVGKFKMHKINESKINQWIIENGFEKKYKLIEWSGTASKKSKFLDLEREVQFEVEYSIFKRNLKRNPSCIFGGTKEELKEQIRKANIKKYGVEHPLQLKTTKEQIKQRNIEKYGVDNVMKLDFFKDKLKNTFIKKYNVEHFSKTEDFKEKIIKKFNSKSEMEIQKINNKRAKTIHEKYGEEGLKNQEIRKKTNKTNIEKYGAENPQQVSEIKKKTEQTNLKRYGSKFIFENNEIKKKIKRAKIQKGIYKEYKSKPLKEWAEEIGFSRTHFNKLVNDYGFEQAIQMTPQESSLETIIKNFLEKEKIDYIHNKKFGDYRPDFLIPEHNLIIECDGLFWHSDKIINNKEYHKAKKEFYESQGYDSLFFRENELKNKFSIVESIISNKIKKSKRIFARKCQIKEVNKNISKDFFEENHLMGNGTGRSYGLYFENVLVCCIQVRWQNKENKLIDISRFAPKLNHLVIGGFSKLINHIKEQENPQYIQTFIDKRYGSGVYLKSLGWSNISNYSSFSWTNGNEAFHRMKFPGNSGYEKGLVKIWDCGQSKFVLNC